MDIIGILGERTDTGVGTYTVYTVPTGKAARVKIRWRGDAPAAAVSLSLRINNIDVAVVTYAASNKAWSTKDFISSVPGAGAPDGQTVAKTVSFCDHEYWLSTGDTVQYVIATNALTTMQMEVGGAEVDVA